MKQNIITERYRLFDHTADIGIDVFGRDLPQLFSNAGYALFDIITDLSFVNEKVVKRIVITGRDLEEMMVNWLGELLYIFETKKIILKYFNILEINTSCSESDRFCTDKEIAFEKIKTEINGWVRLLAEVRGEEYNSEIHVINTTIKAITYHQLQVVKERDMWRSRVVLDV